MRLPHTPGPAKRSVQYLRYRTGSMRSVHTFRREAVQKITLVVPDSLGDIAINSAITRAIRLRGGPSEITLLTDRKYASAVAFNPDYDAVALLDGYTDKPPWALTYQDQLAAAKALTPTMDAVVLCQPGAWCDALWSRYHSLDIQYRLSGTPPALRRLPRLTVPAGAAEAVRPIRQRAVGRTAFIAPGAFTLKFGATGERFFTELAARLAGAGWQVFWNGGAAPPTGGGSGSVVAVGHLPLAQVVALASSCERAVCARSGLADVITFCTPELPQYVLYPRTRYPYSRRAVRECYSLRAMGGVNVCESENSLDTDADLSAELAAVGQWLESPRQHTEPTA
ncbi:hypothetical protein [Micromonospora sp. WMMD987]|uniref:glycosyltransferase family 9 protein n=1 Tax=Micromonospora sp. WMMD987 TaxID=3016089 RepID=UPI00249C85F2|nr:hypothetical protein [Micromonospora sp. WMMD987]WFE96512.1 hypothetical protein O7612_06340 [Micromonospora sp. WMMD987]